MMQQEMTERNLHEHNLSLVSQSRELIIFSPEDNTIANDSLKIIMLAKKAIETYWKEPIEKANQTHKMLTAKKNEMLHPLQGAEMRIKGKIAEYVTREDKKRKKAEKEIQKQAKKDNIPFMPTLKKEEKPQGQVIKHLFSAKVVDFTELPDQYKLPNVVMLNGLARTLKENFKIPGVKLIKTINVQVRT